MKQLDLPPALIADLQQVEQVVLERTHSELVVVSTLGADLLGGESNRLRALVTLVAAQLADYDIARVLHAAAAVELIHAATQTHSELISAAARRRGDAVSGDSWNHGVTLMVGDYLFALAAVEMALAPDQRVIAFFSQAVMAICEGELAPVTVTTPREQALSQYHYTAGRRSAALFEAACKAGMACGQGSPEQIEDLGQFGYQLGMLVHIVEDMLDFIDSDGEREQPLGNTLRQGVIALPLIYAVDASSDSQLAVSIDSNDAAVLGWAIGEVQRVGLDPARSAALDRAEQARQLLHSFPDGAARHLLDGLIDVLLQRIAHR